MPTLSSLIPDKATYTVTLRDGAVIELKYDITINERISIADEVASYVILNDGKSGEPVYCPHLFESAFNYCYLKYFAEDIWLDPLTEENMSAVSQIAHYVSNRTEHSSWVYARLYDGIRDYIRCRYQALVSSNTRRIDGILDEIEKLINIFSSIDTSLSGTDYDAMKSLAGVLQGIKEEDIVEAFARLATGGENNRKGTES